MTRQKLVQLPPPVQDVLPLLFVFWKTGISLSRKDTFGRFAHIITASTDADSQRGGNRR